ncbi:hypothetical protein [Shewanella sp. NFH-SH190041]|uniref:hypothetical protein n=1 Tax=Shewanella sp. NFH-SH190041 TaxID=2950245 RepID=UPI0021C42D8B|nr:hypothetical protein [Shewanella sp. NFH-SH190041]
MLQDKLHLMRDMVEAVGKDVPDPYYGGTGGFDHVLDLLEDVSDAVLERVDALTSGARSALS